MTTHAPAARPAAGRSSSLGLARIARDQPIGTAAAVIAIVLIVAAVLADRIAPFDPVAFEPSRLSPPDPRYLFGTDNFGRDVFSRVLYGARTSLFVGLAAVLIGQSTAFVWGLVSGYVGGAMDLVSQRFVDVLMIFPTLVLALAIVAALGGSLNNVVVAIAISQIAGTTRTIRTATVGIRASDFVLAARTVGCRDVRIVVRHVAPHAVAALIVLASANLGKAILAEASLSFLGLGVPPPNPSWGGMLSGDGRVYLFQAPWIAVAPGIALTLTVLSFNLLGDAIRDLLDPRLRRI